MSVKHVRMPKRRASIAVAAVIAVLAFLLPTNPVGLAPQAADAANSALFDPGLIISDAQFFDGSAMTAPQIQSFLNSKVSNCTGSNGCLFNYRQATPSMPVSPGRCSAYTGSASESAAEIIAKVGQACGVSQKALLVLLEKEQGLVSHSAPSQRRFDAATGMGCPDTAGCDPDYGGFFYQVYYAARQFQVYATTPASWNHRAGRINNIRYSPNASCGTRPVFIVNQATAGLYNYTPYTPNAAALNNLYGIGDGCSSYGNRNFWRIFSDWFGSPTAGSSLVKAADSPRVYVVSGDSKYLVPNTTLLMAFAHLGNIATVSSGVVAAYTGGPTASRIIRAPGGAMFFHDARIKLPIPTCEIVVDYGGSCNPDGYTQLNDAQIATWVTGPTLGNLFGTTTGARFFVDDGVKHQILDSRSKDDAGLVGTYPILTDAALDGLPLGPPIVRDSVLIAESSTRTTQAIINGERYLMSNAVATQSGAATRTVGSLRMESTAFIPEATSSFSSYVSTPSGDFVLTSSGRYRWPALVAGLGLEPIAAADGLVSGWSELGEMGAGRAVKSTTSGTVYLTTDTGIRPFASWNAYLASGAGSIITLPDEIVAALPKQAPVLAPGSLVKTTSDRAVYLVDGFSTTVRLQSFAPSDALGVKSVVVVPDGGLAAYTPSSSSLGFVHLCEGTTFFAAGGSLHEITAALADEYRLTGDARDATTCEQFAVGRPATPFIRVSTTGAIFQVVDGQRRPVTSLARFLQLDPTGQNFINVDPSFAALLPVGTPA